MSTRKEKASAKAATDVSTRTGTSGNLRDPTLVSEPGFLVRAWSGPLRLCLFMWISQSALALESQTKAIENCGSL